MHAKNPNARKGTNATPLGPLSSDAAPPAALVPAAPDNKLSGAFAAALGKSGGRADTPPASVGKDNPRGGSGRPDQINKAPKPAAGMKNFSGHRSGHR
ncbi:MAG: hypothetical protein WDZ83_15055 [Rhizobiaceae bacterium]